MTNMNELRIEKEFSIFGMKVSSRPDSGIEGEEISAEEIVEFINSEARLIKNERPTLSDFQISVLLNLKLGRELITKKKKYLENIEKMEAAALSALDYIEEITSPANAN